MSDTKQIVVAVPNRESSSQMTADLAKTLHQIDAPDTDDDYNVEVSFSYKQPIDANRNEMVKSFLDNPDNEWLYMNDNDVVPPTTILSMIEHDKPVVSGTVCIRKTAVPEPVIFKERGGRYRRVSVSEYEDDVRDDGLLEVDGVGTGALLIRRDVLEQVEPPWFKFKYNEFGGLELGEDFAFSQKLKDNDVPMYVDTEQICRHFKTVELSEFARAVHEARNEGDENTPD